MTTFKEIQGRNIRAVSTDPANPGEGEMWYNKTIGVLKGVQVIAAFSSGSNLSTARMDGGSAQLGTQTAALYSGGYVNPAPSLTAVTEEYNGSGWATGGAMSTARMSGAGGGTQTAAYVAAGQFPSTNVTENYDGTTWTSSGNYPITVHSVAGMGTQTAGLAAGGRTPAPAVTNVSAEYDGTAWTASNNINTARQSAGGTGPQTAGIIFGGRNFTPTDNDAETEVYDGTSWSETADLNTARKEMASAGISSSSAFAVGGLTQPGTLRNSAEQFDGTSWTTLPATLATSREQLGGSGSNSAAVFFGGGTPTNGTAATEEYNFSATVITPAAFSSGGTMNTARSRGTGGGTTNAGIFANGQNVNVEEYNGTSWSEQNNMPTVLRDPSGFGTQTAFVGCAGYTPTGNTNTTNVYDGTNWTTSGNMNTARSSAAPVAAGIITAGLVAQNDQSPYKSVESYNGSTWTTESNVANGRSRGNMTGTESAAFLVNGYGVDPASPQPGVSTTTTENYNGTSWSAGVSSLQGTIASLGMANGNQDNTTIAGGFDQAPFVKLSFVQNYDGTAWSTQPNMGTARYAGIGGGTPSGGFVAGGNATGNTGVTEEFNPESTSANVKTFTTS